MDLTIGLGYLLLFLFGVVPVVVYAVSAWISYRRGKESLDILLFYVVGAILFSLLLYWQLFML